MDRIVPRGFDFSPLGIIPPVLHSHFLSPELYQLLGASLKIYLKRKIKNTKLMMMTVKRFFTRNCLLRSVVGVTIPLWKDYCSNCFPGFNILLTVHHAMILGNCPTWRTNSFQYIYLLFSTCFEHVMLIIRRNKLYQYSFRQLSLHVGGSAVCWLGVSPQPAHGTATNTEWQLPEAVLIQFVSPDDEHDMLETCRAL